MNAKKLVSLATSVLKHVSNGLKPADQQTIQSRSEACSGCDFLDKENNKCNSCGCYLKYKIAWDSESCPEGKW